MLISGADAIRDVILFPTLRPEGRGEADGSEAVASAEAPSASDFAAPSTDGAERPCRAGCGTARRGPGAARPIALTAPARLAERARRALLAAADRHPGPLLARPLHLRRRLGPLGGPDHLGRDRPRDRSPSRAGSRRGKRRAWAIAVVLFAAAAVVHLLHGPGPDRGRCSSAAMLIALIWFRQRLPRAGRPGIDAAGDRLRPGLPARRLRLHLVTLFAERAHVTPDLSFGGIARDRVQGPDRARRPVHVRAHGLRRLLRDRAARARESPGC